MWPPQKGYQSYFYFANSLNVNATYTARIKSKPEPEQRLAKMHLPLFLQQMSCRRQKYYELIKQTLMKIKITVYYFFLCKTSQNKAGVSIIFFTETLSGRKAPSYYLIKIN